MKTYISILRGINVGGKHIVKMDILRKMFENLGFYHISTYIQSGNVIFLAHEIEKVELESKISNQIMKDFGLQIGVIVLSIDELMQVVGNNPFLNDLSRDEAFFHLTFLSAMPQGFDPKILVEKKQIDEEIILIENTIYLYCPNGYGNTKLTNNFLETKLKVAATTRNWKTANELLKIATQTNQAHKQG